MTRSLTKTLSLAAFAFVAATLAGAAVPGAVTSAEARAHGGRHGHHHHHAHRHHRHHFYGHYVNSGYGNCHWLKHRAVNTGMPYWWNRYRSCIGE